VREIALFSGGLARSMGIYVIGLSFWIFLPRAGQRDFFTTSISPFEEDGAVLRLLGEEWCGPVVSSSDNYDNDDSNVTIRAKLEP